VADVVVVAGDAVGVVEEVTYFTTACILRPTVLPRCDKIWNCDIAPEVATLLPVSAGQVPLLTTAFPGRTKLKVALKSTELVPASSGIAFTVEGIPAATGSFEK